MVTLCSWAHATFFSTSATAPTPYVYATYTYHIHTPMHTQRSVSHTYQPVTHTHRQPQTQTHRHTDTRTYSETDGQTARHGHLGSRCAGSLRGGPQYPLSMHRDKKEKNSTWCMRARMLEVRRKHIVHNLLSSCRGDTEIFWAHVPCPCA